MQSLTSEELSERKWVINVMLPLIRNNNSAILQCITVISSDASEWSSHFVQS